MQQSMLERMSRGAPSVHLGYCSTGTMAEVQLVRFELAGYRRQWLSIPAASPAHCMPNGSYCGDKCLNQLDPSVELIGLVQFVTSRRVHPASLL